MASKSDTEAAWEWMVEYQKKRGLKFNRPVRLLIPAKEASEISWPPLPPDMSMSEGQFIMYYLASPVTDDQLKVELITARLQGWDDDSYHSMAIKYIMHLRGLL